MTKCDICHNNDTCPAGMRPSRCGRFATDFDTICTEALELSMQHDISLRDALSIINMVMTHQEA